MPVVIRPETPADIPAIFAVTEAAFRTAAHSAGTEQFIVNALRGAGALAVSLVAEVDGAVVGHVAVSPVSVSDGSTGWYGLGPISVLPGHQRQGIGSRLMRAALQALRDRQAAGCMLVGDPAYYRRFGFRVEPGLRYPGVPPEYFMVVSLGGVVPTGDVAFHDAFGAVA
jgi:predicted N-acetyltransferase YhbS